MTLIHPFHRNQIAWAVCEKLAYEVKCSTIMATHFGSQISSFSSSPPPFHHPLQSADNNDDREAQEVQAGGKEVEEEEARGSRVKVFEMSSCVRDRSNHDEGRGYYERRLVPTSHSKIQYNAKDKGRRDGEAEEQEGEGDKWTGIRLGREMGLPSSLISLASKVASVIEQGQLKRGIAANEAGAGVKRSS